MSDELLQSTDPAAAAAAEALAKSAQNVNKMTKRKKKRGIRAVPLAHVHVQASFNNTLITATDPHGDTLAWASAGGCGFTGPKKATPYAATVTTRVLLERLKPYQVKEAHVFVRGVGTGRESAVRGIHGGGISVLSIKDQTPIPHNGCRRRKARRI